MVHNSILVAYWGSLLHCCSLIFTLYLCGWRSSLFITGFTITLYHFGSQFPELLCISLWFTEIHCVCCGSSWYQFCSLRSIVNHVFHWDWLHIIVVQMVSLWCIDDFVYHYGSEWYRCSSLWITVVHWSSLCIILVPNDIIMVHRGSSCFIVNVFPCDIIVLIEVFCVPLL